MQTSLGIVEVLGLAGSISRKPVSNVVVSSIEDVAAGGLLWLVYTDPVTAGIVAVVLGFLALVLLVVAWRIIGGLFRKTGALPPERPIDNQE